MHYSNDPITTFYLKSLPGKWQDRSIYTAPCPFCIEKGKKQPGTLAVILDPDNFFHGYFRCLGQCTPGGFAQYFALLAKCDPASVPGFDPDRKSSRYITDYPASNYNQEIQAYCAQVPQHLFDFFQSCQVAPGTLKELQIGFNGRYLTYPYIQQDGNCYFLRCVHPERYEDFFWHGNVDFAANSLQIFNLQDLKRCNGGALFLCEGEENLLVLKHLGYPGIAIPHYSIFETLETELFSELRTLFIIPRNTTESITAARQLAAHIGFKVRLLEWPTGTPKEFSLIDLAKEKKEKLRQAVNTMIRHSDAFSPFSSPEREYFRFEQQLSERAGGAYTRLRSGFPRFDASLEGLYGINIIGGAPKTGKSTFAAQLASQMAEKKIPVLYYDFENGKQQLYQRLLSRMSRITTQEILQSNLTEQQNKSLNNAKKQLQNLLKNLRIINDRRITPELMRRHVDFIRHEQRSKYTVVVIDSLHKLPFKNLAERRTGIDAWLRELEAIRDEMQVSFLVLSELLRGEKSYTEAPHLGIFKGSGDIEYSADNAMVLHEHPDNKHGEKARRMNLWNVASREHQPGLIAEYILDYPYWGFIEQPL